MKPQAGDAGHLGSFAPPRCPTSALNSSVSEPLGEVRVFQVDLVYTPKFNPVGQGKSVLCGVFSVALSAVKIGSFSRGVQLKVAVMPHFLLQIEEQEFLRPPRPFFSSPVLDQLRWHSPHRELSVRL